MSTPVWEVQLRKTLRQAQARFDLDVAFRSGARRLALFGPSGAGKTQTLRMIAGIDRPDAGRIAVDGRVLFDVLLGIDQSARERRLAYMFQDYALFPHLTVRQNIAFALHQGIVNPRCHASQAMVDDWINRFGLEAVRDLHPSQLSGGQRQRTALARALVARPQALLLDEPFAALDRKLRERLRAELAELQQQLGLPMLLITHDEEDLQHLADEVIPIEGGRVLLAR